MLSKSAAEGLSELLLPTGEYLPVRSLDGEYVVYHCMVEGGTGRCLHAVAGGGDRRYEVGVSWSVVEQAIELGLHGLQLRATEHGAGVERRRHRASNGLWIGHAFLPESAIVATEVGKDGRFIGVPIGSLEPGDRLLTADYETCSWRSDTVLERQLLLDSDVCEVLTGVDGWPAFCCSREASVPVAPPAELDWTVIATPQRKRVASLLDAHGRPVPVSRIDVKRSDRSRLLWAINGSNSSLLWLPEV